MNTILTCFTLLIGLIFTFDKAAAGPRGEARLNIESAIEQVNQAADEEAIYEETVRKLESSPKPSAACATLVTSPAVEFPLKKRAATEIESFDPKYLKSKLDRRQQHLISQLRRHELLQIWDKIPVDEPFEIPNLEASDDFFIVKVATKDSDGLSFIFDNQKFVIYASLRDALTYRTNAKQALEETQTPAPLPKKKSKLVRYAIGIPAVALASYGTVQAVDWTIEKVEQQRIEDAQARERYWAEVSKQFPQAQALQPEVENTLENAGRYQDRDYSVRNRFILKFARANMKNLADFQILRLANRASLGEEMVETPTRTFTRYAPTRYKILTEYIEANKDTLTQDQIEDLTQTRDDKYWQDRF